MPTGIYSSTSKPTTPTANISFSSSQSQHLANLSRSASTSRTSFNHSLPKEASLPHTPQYSPHSSWIPGSTYIPGSQSAPLVGITHHPQTNGMMSSQGNFNILRREATALVMPEDLAGPLQMREEILRARDRERATSMGFDTATSYPQPQSTHILNSEGSNGNFDSLLAATGIVNLNESIGPSRGARMNSGASVSSWSPSISAGSLSRNTSMMSAKVPEKSFNGSMISGVAGGVGVSSIGSPSLAAEDLSASVSSVMASDKEGIHTLERIPSSGGEEVSTATPAPTNAPPPRPRKSSIRNTLPSIRSFRNPFSFSRNASTSGNTRDKSKEREKSSERLPLATGRGSESSINLTAPITVNSGQRSPISQAFVSPIAHATMPRASVDTIVPSSQSHSTHSTNSQISGHPLSSSTSNTFAPSHTHHESISHTPGATSKFGFGGGKGNARHSIDSPAGVSKLGSIFRTSTTSSIPGREPIQSGYVNGSKEHVFHIPASKEGSRATPVNHLEAKRLGVAERDTQPPSPLAAFLAGQRPSPASSGNSPGLAGVGSAARSPTPPASAQHPPYQPSYHPSAQYGNALELGVRPHYLPPHLEVDEVSTTTRTESGYGFGGIRVGSNGIILEEDTRASRLYEDGGYEGREEVREELLAHGIFDGEYESTEGHATVQAVGSLESHQQEAHPLPLARSLPHVHARQDSLVLLDDPYRHLSVTVEETSQTSSPKKGNGNKLDGSGQPSPVEMVPYPYPTSFPSQGETDTTGGLQDKAPTSASSGAFGHVPSNEKTPLPPKNVSKPSHVPELTRHDSAVERELLNDLAKHLQRVVKQQSMASIARSEVAVKNVHAFPQRSQTHTPSSVLQLDSTSGLTSRIEQGQDEHVDEWGRWNIEDLKGAVERMKNLIDEQEKRMKKGGHGHSSSRASFSSIWTGMTLSPTIEQKEGAPATIQATGSLQTTPQQSQQLLPRPEEEIDESVHPTRKESQSSSSATGTATSTTVVTPVTPSDGQPLPWPSKATPAIPVLPQSTPLEQLHDRSTSFDLGSLDPDLLAMLTPNHLTTRNSAASSGM